MHPRPVAAFAFFLSLLLLLPCAKCLIEPNRSCSVVVFAPFTNARGESLTGIDLTGEDDLNVGFMQMASAFMAAKHFNARDASVVSQLAKLDDSCNVTIHISNTSVIDTVQPSHVASQRLYERGAWPCAAVGPASDIVAMELSAVAQAAQFPLVISKACNLRSVFNMTSSFSASVFPDLLASAHAISTFLLYKERVNYVSLLYERSDTGLQRLESLTSIFEEKEVEFYAHGYSIEIENARFRTFDVDALSPRDALTSIQRIGYRTIIISMDNVTSSFLEICDAVEELNMNNGDFFFVWYDRTSLERDYGDNENATKLLEGSAIVFPFSGIHWNETTKFEQSWYEQGQELVDTVNAANPIEPGQTGYMYAKPDFFQTTQPGFEASFMYDAVMSVGLGACNATMESDGSTTGRNHHTSILGSNFGGATGLVSFGSVFQSTGVNSRVIDSVTWGTLNLWNGSWNVTDVAYAGTNLTWLEVAPFHFASGSTNPPLPLRTPGQQNYIGGGLRSFGLAVMSLTILVVIGCMAWLFIHRKDPLVVSAKPGYMHVICIGVAIEVSTIFCSVFDEGAGWSDQSLNRMCAALPWLLFVGLSLQYSALFTRLWRVHKVFNLKERQVEIKILVGPMALLQLTVVALLSAMSGIDAVHWERTVLNDDTNETVGGCTSDSLVFFGPVLLAVVLTQMAMTAMTTFMIRTKEDKFPETWWILLMVVVQLEAVLVSVPVVFILEDQTSTGVGLLAFMIIIWLLSASTLGLFIIPRIYAFYLAKRDIAPKRKRGQIGGVHVTGVQD